MTTARQPRVRTKLVIRCTGQPVSQYKFRPTGRVCGRVFKSARAYRSRADWIERARVAGWRVSPLRPDNTVDAYCPRCKGA